MRVRNVKNKEEIISNSIYTIDNPESYKGKWQTLFNNNNPIYLEIGMGKGKFILENAKNNPNINYIGKNLDSKKSDELNIQRMVVYYHMLLRK